MTKLLKICRSMDEESVEIYVDDTFICCANHDEHGWSGMEDIVNVATSVAEAAGMQIIKTYIEE